MSFFQLNRLTDLTSLQVPERLIDILIFLTYEFKIVLALAGYNNFAENFEEISYYISGDSVSIAVK